MDLYQAHRFDEQTPLEETLIAFDDLVRQGKVLYLGRLGVDGRPDPGRRSDLADELGLRSRIVSNQPQYNMLWRVIEPQVLPLCQRERDRAAGFSAARSGRSDREVSPGRAAAAGLTGGQRGPGPEVHPPGARRSTPGTGAATASARGRTLVRRMAQLAIAWTLQTSGVSSAIIGASRPEQVSENAAAAGIRLEASLLARIDDLLGHLVDRDPAKTAQMMMVKPDWAQPAG